MSTATAEKPKPKPVAPLGSFLTKLTPKPVEKPIEKATDEKVEVNDVTVPSGPTDEGKTVPTVTEEAPAAKAAATSDKPEPKVEDKPKDDKTEKRLKDAQTWGNEEHKARLAAEREAQELKAQLARIEAKLDGTYEEPAAPSIEQVKANADMTGRVKASHKAAVRLYGEPFVMKTVWNLDSPYMELQAGDPRVRDRVMDADDPVLEAIAVVKEHQDGLKWGRTPEEIRKNIEAELAPKLKQEILEGLKTKPGPATNTLGNVRGGTERTAQKSDAPAGLDFRQVFPWGASRR